MGNAGARAVLLVEDDEGNRDALAEACSEVGVKVFLARDGDEALALLETIPRPCLVVVDVLMPRLGGRELIARLADRDDAAEIPVLVVTATREAGLDSLPGVIGVLQKPFDLEDLLRFVEQHCSADAA